MEVTPDVIKGEYHAPFYNLVAKAHFLGQAFQGGPGIKQTSAGH